jgi:hypothetical protein
MSVFSPPTDDFVRYGDGLAYGPAARLWRFYKPEARGRNVYLLNDGTYSEVDQRDVGQVVKIYQGGHIHPVDAGEVASLTAAGYGAYIS